MPHKSRSLIAARHGAAGRGLSVHVAPSLPRLLVAGGPRRGLGRGCVAGNPLAPAAPLSRAFLLKSMTTMAAPLAGSDAHAFPDQEPNLSSSLLLQAALC